MKRGAVLRNGWLGVAVMSAVFGTAVPGNGWGQNYAQRAAQARSQVPAAQPRPQGYGAPAAGTSGARPRAMVGVTAAQAVAMGQAVASGVNGLSPARPRPVAASSSLAGLRQALTAFYADTGRMPTAAEGLNALLRAPAGVRNWRGPYISVVSGRPPFTDPWGNPYRFIDTSNGSMTSYQIRSNGPDGLPNTADDLSISG